MGAEPGRRFLMQPAAKLESESLLSIRRGESQPLVLPLKWSGHQLKNFERQGTTYELLLEIFSMKNLNSLLYRNCSVNFFTVPPELTRVGLLDFFPLHITVCCKPHDRLRQKPRETRRVCFVSQKCLMAVAICVCWTVLWLCLVEELQL